MATIDHHELKHNENGQASGFPADIPQYVESHAPSTTFLIFELIKALGMTPLKNEAELLFFGLCTDTGFFRHLDNEGAESFDMAAALVRLGANPKSAFAEINGGKSLDSRRLLGLVLGRAESFFDSKLIISTEEYEETCRFGLEGRDSDSLYQLLQAVAGVEAIIIIRQETPEKCTVGLRSRDHLDVAYIAENFRGGGHKNAAGFSAVAAIEELKPELIKAFEKLF